MNDALANPPWYRSHSLQDGVTHLYEAYVDPYFRCNIWHVRGRDRSLLIDSGMGVVSLAGQFPWLRQSPLLAVASHTHYDHIGCHHEFAQRACHGTEADILAHPDRERTVWARYCHAPMFERLPPGGFDPETYTVAPAPATQLLADGDILDLGDRHLTVLHVPGHSPGSIALWEERTGMLFTGDAVYDGDLVDDNFNSSPGQYRETMHRLRELPVRTVHCGHYASFGRERFLVLIDDYLAGRRQPGCPFEARPPKPHP